MNRSTYAPSHRSTSATILDADSLAPGDNQWDLAILVLLAMLLAFMPFAYGGVSAMSELIVIGGSALLTACLFCRAIFDRSFSCRGSWLFAPLILLLGLFTLQLVTLPESAARLLSPQTVEKKAELLSDIDRATDNVAISFYPWETAHYLRLSLAAVTMFAVAVTFFGTRRAVIRLLAVIFVVGVAQAILALLQILSMTRSIYWLDYWLDDVPSGPVVTAGSFVNYSNFSQFINLSLGAGLALLLVRMHDDRQPRRGRLEWRPAAGGQWWEDTRWLIAGIVICAVSVFTSMSRNGAISLTVAGTVVGSALYLRGSLSRRGWLLAVLPFGALFALLLFAFDDVYARLATLQDEEHLFNRWEMTLATLDAWQAYPIWGAGLGTHEFVFPMFDTAVTPVVAERADNDYAQLLEETGIVGATLLAVFLGGVATLGVRLMRSGKSSLSAAAFGIMFGLIAVGIHSATDFGQRLPANFCVTALLCGLMASIWRLERNREDKGPSRSQSAMQAPAARIAVAVVGLVAAAGVWTWALRGAYGAYIGEKWQHAAYGVEVMMSRSESGPTLEDYRDVIYARENAFDADPTNVKAGYWLNQYRWLGLSRSVQTESGTTNLPPESLPVVEQIADEVAGVRTLCPTFGPPALLEGELRWKWLQQKELGAKLIRQGYELAKYYAPACAMAGELAASQGNFEEAAKLLNRSVALAPGYFRSTVDYYLRDMQRPDLARELAGNDYRRLRYLANAVGNFDQFSHLAAEFREHAIEELRETAASVDATARDLAALAAIEARSGNHEAAVDLYSRALVSDYGNVNWRLALARSLAAAGNPQEAIAEARLCLKLRPQWNRAINLISELSVQVPAE